jgi:hypothetical protein
MLLDRPVFLPRTVVMKVHWLSFHPETAIFHNFISIFLKVSCFRMKTRLGKNSFNELLWLRGGLFKIRFN